jgi:hypothetical protein
MIYSLILVQEDFNRRNHDRNDSHNRKDDSHRRNDHNGNHTHGRNCVWNNIYGRNYNGRNDLYGRNYNDRNDNNHRDDYNDE